MGLAAVKAEKRQEQKNQETHYPTADVRGCVPDRNEPMACSQTQSNKQDVLQPAEVKVLEMQNNTSKHTCNHSLFQHFDHQRVEIAVKSMARQSLTSFVTFVSLEVNN